MNPATEATASSGLTTGSNASVMNTCIDVSKESVDYWTDLLQRNINKATQISNDIGQSGASNSIDEEILNAPRRKSARDALAQAVAARMNPLIPVGSLAAIIQYEKDVVRLRQLVIEQRRAAIAKATEKRQTWIRRIGEQGPWDEINDPLSLAGAPALPMPVEVASEESMQPFFKHLHRGGTHDIASSPDPNLATPGVEPYYNVEMIEYEKGVLYSDGRVDLCKMVTGPRNINGLMESLKTNKFAKHFLLGNNIIGPQGAKAIAAFIDDYPDRFETWYLAGNCIDGDSFTGLVDSMVKSPAITNVWLKRNPLGPKAAQDVFRLIRDAPNLRTLDLDQTELGDEGVASIFASLASYAGHRSLSLENIYLNATGIGRKACEQISLYLASPACTLQSLYMSNNPIGDGVWALSSGLRTNKTLKRLSMQSCGLKDADGLLEALINHPTLQVLDLGQSYATNDLGMRFNWLTNESVLVRLLGSTKLKYLNLSYVPMQQDAMNKVLETASVSETLLWFSIRHILLDGVIAPLKLRQHGAHLEKAVRKRLHENVKRDFDGLEYEKFENEHKRFLVSPKDVRLIDSVYRNRDAGLARRGLKRLDKWWDEDDETLSQLQNGTLA